MPLVPSGAHLGPESPMTWPLWWRVVMLGSLCFFVMMGQFLSASIPPMIVHIMVDLHVDGSQVSQLASWATLAVGLGNIWAVPTVAYIGSRYTILIGLVVFTACFFWQGASQTYDSLLAARIVGGLGGGVVESLGPVMVVLLFPREYVARAMSVYTFALGAGTVFGPLIAGYMVENLGSWRYPNYLFGGISALNLIATILMFPEPIMNIRVPGDPEVPISQDGSLALDETQITEPKAASEEAGRAEQHEIQPHSLKMVGPYKPSALWFRRSFFLTLKHNQPVSNYLLLMAMPFKVLALPSVIVTVLLFGVTIAITISISVLVSLTYSAPPLLWSPGQLGLYNIAVLLGLLAGVPIGGVLADWLAARYLRRHGYFKPESILPILILFSITTPTATTLAGVGLQRGWHWAIVGLLWAIVNANLTGGSNIMIAYSTDSYPEKAIDIGVVVNIIKNAIGFGVSYSTVEWWTHDKHLMFVTLATVVFAIFLGALPLWIWGPKITRKTKTWILGLYFCIIRVVKLWWDTAGLTSRIKLLSPIATHQVSPMRCMGLNYRDHAAEAKMPIPDASLLFIKPRTVVCGPWSEKVNIPNIAQDGSSDNEAELAIVISRDGRDIPVAEAEHQGSFSKGFDGSAPLGPMLVAPSAIQDPHQLSIRAIHNSNVVQKTNTREMIFSVAEMISFLSQGTTLEKGTVILTGTGLGIGFLGDLKVVLSRGDDMGVEIEKLGTLINEIY